MMMLMGGDDVDDDRANAIPRRALHAVPWEGTGMDGDVDGY